MFPGGSTSQCSAFVAPTSHSFHYNGPGFRLTGLNGNVEPQTRWGDGNSSESPVLPEVHEHIDNVVNDIAANYAVDGIHLDYIRYVPGNSFSRLPHDAVSRQLFSDYSGGLDGSNQANATTYRNYAKSRITDLVGSVKQTVDTAEISTGRTIELTATVSRGPDVGDNDYYQDYRT